ncbi:MAG: XisI protein [Caldilineaceae bacterium]|nr:XisI protein [Caldilineaceae bacterium]
MEPIAGYQESVKKILSQYEQLETEHSKVLLLFDDMRMDYMAVRVGWMNQRRIHVCLVHIEIVDNHVVIHCNNTEDMIAAELVELGIPAAKIRLGFLPPEYQEYTSLPVKHKQLELA